MKNESEQSRSARQVGRDRYRGGRLWLLPAVLSGGLGCIVFTYYALIDWSALQAAYAHYAQVVAGGGDLRAVFVAETAQNIHRINLFAEGVWALLAAILAAIGLHGMAVPNRLPARRSDGTL